jgi:hypothetical protein
LATAAGLALYWVLFFTVGLAPADPPPGYFVFEHSFTLADIVLAAAYIRAAMFLLSNDVADRVVGSGWSLVCGGATLFLGGLDVGFHLQSGVFPTLSMDIGLEIAINLWCFGFGLLLVYEFLPDLRQRP